MRASRSPRILLLVLLLLAPICPCSSATSTSSQTVVPPSIAQSVEQAGTSSSSSLENKTFEISSSSSNSSSSSSFVDDKLPEWRKQLPLELRNKTKTLQRIIVPGTNGCRVEVYLLGTAHVSIDSSRDVRRLLETVDPSVLFLELCDQRIPMMLSPPPTNATAGHEVVITPEEKLKAKAPGLWGRIRNRSKKSTSSPPRASRSMYGMAAGLLTNMQQDYAESLGVELGGEFRVAYNYWDEHRQHKPIHMILGDRPLYLTLTRAWEGLGIWGKIKLVVSLLVSSFQKPDPAELKEWMQKILADDTGDLLTESIAELAQHFPTLEKVIIQERDAYMACKLYQTCRQLLSQQYPRQTMPQVQRLVAIVGAGHVQGMCQLLTQGNGRTPEETLAPLVEIKKSISEEDRRVLIFDVLEVNHEQLKALAQDMDASANPP